MRRRQERAARRPRRGVRPHGLEPRAGREGVGKSQGQPARANLGDAGKEARRDRWGFPFPESGPFSRAASIGLARRATPEGRRPCFHRAKNRRPPEKAARLFRAPGPAPRAAPGRPGGGDGPDSAPNTSRSHMGGTDASPFIRHPESSLAQCPTLLCGWDYQHSQQGASEVRMLLG